MADEVSLWQVEDDNLKEISRTKLNRENVSRNGFGISSARMAYNVERRCSICKKEAGARHWLLSFLPVLCPGRTNAGISDRHISSTARCPFAGSPFCGAQRRERQPCADTSTPTVFPGLSHFVSGFT